MLIMLLEKNLVFPPMRWDNVLTVFALSYAHGRVSNCTLVHAQDPSATDAVSRISKGKSLLTWETRYKIVQDLTSALLYLYEEGDYCVLHRDIKTNNIMLDSSFDDKLGDYGLARLVDHSKGLKNTLLAGVGHIALECLSSGKASEESDIYSFGVVAHPNLELRPSISTIPVPYYNAPIALGIGTSEPIFV
ncbi:hypothetical protein GOBAR_AA13388 [Gossypium barbadense]|uniref:Protein kinase domain-containing protein n=1 Tax=Gossypium barbadense TaxID=3634 RepID=A0A2P5XV87_GOSBA|nr:hypothetical protein GOBAR_AA13388 [Gossypium barbadense]